MFEKKGEIERHVHFFLPSCVPNQMEAYLKALVLFFFTCARKAKAVDDGVIRLAPHTGLGERQGVIALCGAPVVHCLTEGRREMKESVCC